MPEHFADSSSPEGFVWDNPTRLVVGKHAVSRLGAALKEAGAKHVILIYGQGAVKRVGAYGDVLASLSEHGITFIEHGGIRPNPEISGVVAIIQKIRNAATRVDAIVPIGGGSTFDTAKAAAVGAALDASVPAETIWEYYEGTRTADKAMPIFGVLTISATGSEANGGTVVQDDSQQKKFYFVSHHLFPRYSFIDPTYQASLPWYQTANGLVDAMTHTFEYLTNAENPREHETVFALDCALIRSIIACGDRLQKDPGDYAARANFVWAASCALNGFSGVAMKGGCWTVHMLEHAMGAVNPKVSHGAGLGVALPAFIRARAEKGEMLQAYNRCAREIFDVRVTDDDRTDKGWKGLIEGIQAVLLRWGHPTTLDELFGKKMTDGEREELLQVYMKKPVKGEDLARAAYLCM